MPHASSKPLLRDISFYTKFISAKVHNKKSFVYSKMTWQTDDPDIQHDLEHDIHCHKLKVIVISRS